MSALAVTPIFTPTRILDLGCGNGRTIDKIGWTVAPGDWVVGVDLNSPALHGKPESKAKLSSDRTSSP